MSSQKEKTRGRKPERLGWAIALALVASAALHFGALRWVCFRELTFRGGASRGPFWIEPSPGGEEVQRSARRRLSPPSRVLRPKVAATDERMTSAAGQEKGAGASAEEPGRGMGPAALGTLSLGVVLAAGNALPDYPEEARDRGWEGTVVLRLQLESGRVTKAQIERTSGHAILDAAAVRAAAAWTLPDSDGPRLIPIRFQLD